MSPSPLSTQEREMPTRQTTFFTGMSRRNEPEFVSVGPVVELIHTHVFNPTGILIADPLELFRIFPGTQILHWEWVTANLPVTNLTVGFMTGEPGDLVTARTVGSQLNGPIAAATGFSSTLAQVAAFPVRGPNDPVVSVGLSTSADISAAANRSITFRIRYTGVNP